MSITRNGSIMVQGASASGILSGTYGGTGANLTPTTAGNTIFTTDGTNWSSTQKIVQGTAVNGSGSGTTIPFSGIPSWVKRITVILNGLSASGNSTLYVQLGTSGGFVTSGYNSNFGAISSAGVVASGAAYTAGFFAGTFVANTDTLFATHVIHSFGNNTWSLSGTGTRTGNVTTWYAAGAPLALGAALTQLRIVPANGTDTFDAGSVNILYE